MAATTRLPLPASAVLGLSLALLLGACSPQAGAPEPGGFEPATRTQPNPTDGQVHRFEIVSRVRATWIDADAAASGPSHPLCADGQNWDHVEISPKLGPGLVFEQYFPAGTVFARTWRCADKYPGEITFSRGTRVDQAQQQVRDALQATGLEGNAAQLVLVHTYGGEERKYDAIEKVVGDTVADAVAVCGARPLRMHSPVIGEWSSDDPAIDRESARIPMFIGIRIDCDGDGSPSASGADDR